MEVIGDIVFNVCLPTAKQMKEVPALIVSFDKKTGQLTLNLNKEFAYRIMADKDLLVAGLNKKLSELIQSHLDAKAREEADLEAGK